MQKFNIAKIDHAMKRRSSGGAQKSIRAGQDPIAEEPFMGDLDRNSRKADLAFQNKQA